MNFVVVGIGYVGKRVLSLLPEGQASGISRSLSAGIDQPVQQLNLDQDAADSLSMADPYSLLYTVAPSDQHLQDERLSNLLQRLSTAPKRIVYISSSGVYGDCAGALVDEETATNASTPRAQRRVAAENLLHRWCFDHASELVILRTPAIYGPGRLGIERLLGGTSVIAEAEAPPGNRIHIDDLTACCVQALTDAVRTGIYNIGDGDFRSTSWFSQVVARLGGIAPPPQVSRSVAEKTFTEARLSFLRESRMLDNRKMLAELKVELRYADAEDGIRASLEEQADSNAG